MSSIETAVIYELIKEYHRIMRETLCTHQDDAMGCFDRIILDHAILNSRKYDIHDNVCKVYSIAHEKISIPAPQSKNYMEWGKEQVTNEPIRPSLAYQ